MARSTPKTSKKKSAKKAVATQQPVSKHASTPATARRIRLPKYRSFLAAPRVKHPVKLSSGWNTFQRACLTVWSAKKLFLGIVVIYGLLTLVLVQGLGNTSDIQSLKDSFSGAASGQLGHLVSGLAIFSFLVASSGNSANTSSSPYQTILVLFISLVVIWALRQTMAGAVVRVRDAFYRGTYPLMVFLLVLLVVCLQLLPLYIGAQLYSFVVTGGIAVLLIEKVLWGMLFFLLALLSLYMLASSLFALYISTLPDMTPMKALRSARELVRYRRWTVLRKLLYLAFILLLVAFIIMLPFILLLTAVAAWVFFILSMVGIVLVHAYMYTLYRDLLVEVPPRGSK
jgi:hypothetical protein